MRNVIVIAVLVVVGCKKEGRKQSETTTPTSPEAVIDGAGAARADAAEATAGTPQPCPTDAALKEVAAKAFGAGKPEHVADISCHAMSTPRKVWALDGTVFTGEIYEGSLALVDAKDGTVIAKESTGSSDQGLAKAAVEVADLDGDGADELLRSATEGANGVAAETLHVLAVRGDKLVPVGALPVRSENTGAVATGQAKKKDAYECTSTRKVIDGPPGKKLIEVVAPRRVGKPPAAECPAEGRHVYSFDGTAIAETKAP